MRPPRSRCVSVATRDRSPNRPFGLEAFAACLVPGPPLVERLSFSVVAWALRGRRRPGRPPPRPPFHPCCCIHGSPQLRRDRPMSGQPAVGAACLPRVPMRAYSGHPGGPPLVPRAPRERRRGDQRRVMPLAAQLTRRSSPPELAAAACEPSFSGRSLASSPIPWCCLLRPSGVLTRMPFDRPGR